MTFNRTPPPFDTNYFKKLRQQEGNKPVDEVFNHIFENNHWTANSRSGLGSGDDQTAEIKRQLPGILKQLGVQVFLDVPCSDFNWLSELDLGVNQYIGGDIVPALVEQNRQKYGRPNRQFHHLNLLTDPLPAADLLFCRDCLVHLSNSDILQAVANVKKSCITYLMTTTFPDGEVNEDITTGDWRIINLQNPLLTFRPLSCCSMKNAPKAMAPTPTRAWVCGKLKHYDPCFSKTYQRPTPPLSLPLVAAWLGSNVIFSFIHLSYINPFYYAM